VNKKTLYANTNTHTCTCTPLDLVCLHSHYHQKSHVSERVSTGFMEWLRSAPAPERNERRQAFWEALRERRTYSDASLQC